MLTYDPADPDPARKLLNYVLLMAARDAAAVVRLEPVRGRSVDMWYFVDGASWYELVPAPPGLWAGMKRAIRTAAVLHPHHQPEFTRRWWLLRPAPVWSGGVLDHHFGSQTTRWAVMLDERRGRECLTLAGVNPAGPSGDAAAMLCEVIGRHDRQPEPVT
jgi:hypothetical protein